MSRNAIETVMGAVVLVIAGGFLYTAYKGQDVGPEKDGAYHVTAIFDNVAGISDGSDVRVGGVKVGVVDGLTLDPQSFQAQVGLTIAKNYALPKDTTASIIGDGLLGNKFVALQPGADENMLKEGNKITITQSAVSLEELIGKFVFSGGGVDGDDKESDDEGGASDDELSVP